MKTFVLLLALVCQLRAVEVSFPEGTSVIILVTADGTRPFAYQWYKNGALISGANKEGHEITRLTKADEATYTCRVSNKAGDAMSDGATVTVVVKPSNAVTAVSVPEVAGGAVPPKL